jgi:hypothetical protein
MRMRKFDMDLIKNINGALQKQERNIGIRQLLIETFNRELHKQEQIMGIRKLGVELIETSDRGIGLKAMKSFNPKELIVEYTGDVITPREVSNRANIGNNVSLPPEANWLID